MNTPPPANTPIPPTPPMSNADDPDNAVRPTSRRWRTPALIALAIVLVGANATMVAQVTVWGSDRDQLEARIEKDAASVAALRTEIAELEAALDLVEQHTDAAETWLAVLGDSVTEARETTTVWRELAEALNECNNARRAIAVDARKRGSSAVASAERAADSQCTAALNQYESVWKTYG